MKSAFVQDEKDWAHEYADIPQANSNDTSKKSSADHRNAAHLINLTEFSGFLPGSNRTLSEVSIGQYFSNKCEDVRGIIENASPPKKFNEPIPLLKSDSIASNGMTASYVGGYSQGKTKRKYFYWCKFKFHSIQFNQQLLHIIPMMSSKSNLSQE